MYYNYDRIMSYDGLFNFILSPRGNGKTYGAKYRCIKNFLKNGEQFIYVRRYKTELKKRMLFFDDIRDKFPNHKLEVKGNNMYCDGKIMGYFIPLSTSRNEKSTSYPNVTTIIFDEFVIGKGNVHYLQEEVETFLDLYETVNRLREKQNKKPCKCLFLANKVSIVNPYFIFFNSVPRNNERFNVFKDGNIVIEQFTDEGFIEEKYKTRFGKLIKGTQYGDYAIENKSLQDNESFVVNKKPRGLEFLFSIHYNGNTLGVWINYKEGICYCSNKELESSKMKFVLTKDDLNINYMIYDKLTHNFLFSQFIKYFKYGLVYYENIQIKTLAYEVLQFLGVR